MAHPYHHAVSSAKKFGGEPVDYLPIHNWFDESKARFPYVQHRTLRHHSEGIFECEKIFGVVFGPHDTPTRWIGEQHVEEDLSFIPTFAFWIKDLPIQEWMSRSSQKLSRHLVLGD